MSDSPLNAALNRNWIAASAERKRLERENAALREELSSKDKAISAVLEACAEVLGHDVVLGELPGELEEARKDAERFLWMTADHDDVDVRERVVNLCNRLPAMSISAVRMYIDAAIARGKGEK